MFIHVINADFTELDQVELWINIIHNTVDPENTYDPFLGLRLDKIHRYKYIQLNEINTWFMSFIEDEKNKLNIIENIILVNECTIKEIDSGKTW